MKRTTIDVPMNAISVDEVISIYDQILVPAGFNRRVFNGEDVWAKGDGTLIKIQSFALAFSDRSVQLQAWLHDNLTGDSDLTGFVAAIPKKKMLDLLENVRSRILQEDMRAANRRAVQSNDSSQRSGQFLPVNTTDQSTGIPRMQRASNLETKIKNFCPYCGHSIKPGAVFCSNCGERID